MQPILHFMFHQKCLLTKRRRIKLLHALSLGPYYEMVMSVRLSLPLEHISCRKADIFDRNIPQHRFRAESQRLRSQVHIV